MKLITLNALRACFMYSFPNLICHLPSWPQHHFWCFECRANRLHQTDDWLSTQKCESGWCFWNVLNFLHELISWPACGNVNILLILPWIIHHQFATERCICNLLRNEYSVLCSLYFQNIETGTLAALIHLYLPANSEVRLVSLIKLFALT